MSDFVSSILQLIFVFDHNQILQFLKVQELSQTDYILFNMTFWVVLGVFFNFVYRGLKFLYKAFFE